MTTQPQLRVLSLGWGVQSWTLAAMMAFLWTATTIKTERMRHQLVSSMTALAMGTAPQLAHGMGTVTTTGMTTEWRDEPATDDLVPRRQPEDTSLGKTFSTMKTSVTKALTGPRFRR